MTLTHASTFSGIGAPEVAAEMLGWDNLFHCEINPFGRAVLDYYFTNAKSYEDITQTDFSEWRGKVNVLTGGFPCQPFSYAGKRRGSEDDRYLWPYVLRCIEQVQPDWFIGENVAGITTMVFPGEDVTVGSHADLFGEGDALIETHERYVLNDICEGLERAGYSVQPLLIPACSVGAPHRRDRVWIIAHRDGVTTYTPSVRRREIYAKIQSQFANGELSECDGSKSIITDTESQCDDGNKSEQREHGESQSSQLGRGSGEDGSEWTATDTDMQRCNESNIANQSSKEERFGSKADINWRDTIGLLPENRWRTFPTVSPVYRGNDGLPFDVDDLTIPFSEWKKESLKAYGNAWCVQVGYEIMRAIDELETLRLNNNN